MDTKSLIKEAKARFNHNASKALLKDKYESKLIVADQNGLWKASPELIGFLASLEQERVIVMDSFDNPVNVNRRDLLAKLLLTYNSVMHEWNTEWSKLEKNR